MADDAELPPGLHFAGVNTRLLVRFLREHEAPGTVERVLSEAGETRTEALWLLIQYPGRCPATATVVRSSGTGATVMKVEFVSSPRPPLS